MKEQKNVIFTPIINRALLSKDIKNKDKFILIKLKSMSKNNISTITITNLKKKCHISDNRTILQSLKSLKQYEFISYDEFETIPKQAIEIKLIYYEDDHKSYTKVDNDMIDKICNLFPNPHNPLILYYLLENNYNVSYEYSCPSREYIKEYITVSNKTLTEYITIMHNNFICEYCQGIFLKSDDGEFNHSNRLRNRYIPNTIRYKQGEDNIGKRRYARHKPKSFFFKETKVVNDE